VTLKNSNKIFVSKEYREFLDELKLSNPKLYQRLCNKIREIRSNPFKSKFKTLKNTDGYRRARLGEYRIVYFVEGNNILITRIGLRQHVYKKEYTVNHFTINEFY
jgi:mRNA-degrading endonuclease RelE of RelBE toxin-antitoxin system